MNVFQNDDGIIHDQPDRQQERKKGEHIDRESECRDHRKAADQRNGDRHGGDQRGPERTQEQQDHQHDQCQGDSERDQNFADGGGDEQRIVRSNDDPHAFGHGRFHGDDFRPDLVRYRHRIGLALPDDLQADRRLPVGAYNRVVVLDPADDRGHITDADRITVDGRDGDVAELFGRGETAVQSNVDLALTRCDFAGRQLNIVAPDRGLDVRYSEVAGRQRTSVEPDPDGKTALAAYVDGGDTVEGRQTVNDEPLDIIGDFFR